MSFEQADPAFLDDIIDVANAMRFLSFLAKRDGTQFRPIPGKDGFMAGTEQGVASMWRDAAGVTGTMEPDPNNSADFGETSFLLKREAFTRSPFMNLAISPGVDAAAPPALIAFAEGFDEIQTNGRILAHKHDGQPFGLITAVQSAEDFEISSHVEALARGLDVVSANRNEGFVIYLRSPALGSLGSIVPGDHDGTIFRPPASNDPNPGRAAIGIRLSLLARLAQRRPTALQVNLSSDPAHRFDIIPFSFTYALPSQAADARAKGEEAFTFLKQLPD